MKKEELFYAIRDIIIEWSLIQTYKKIVCKESYSLFFYFSFLFSYFCCLHCGTTRMKNFSIWNILQQIFFLFLVDEQLFVLKLLRTTDECYLHSHAHTCTYFNTFLLTLMQSACVLYLTFPFNMLQFSHKVFSFSSLLTYFLCTCGCLNLSFSFFLFIYFFLCCKL